MKEHRKPTGPKDSKRRNWEEKVKKKIQYKKKHYFNLVILQSSKGRIWFSTICNKLCLFICNGYLGGGGCQNKSFTTHIIYLDFKD